MTALVLALALGNCLPTLEVPAAWQACTADSDCVLASDACRSCGNFLPVNAKHKAAATQLDLDRRKAAACTLSCEACSPALVRVRCVASKCEAKTATDRARGALAPFKKALKEALVAALKVSPEAAITVCAAQAPALAAAASTGGVTLGRSSPRLRSPANAPRPWVVNAMKVLSAKPADGASEQVDLGEGRIGYAETILIQPMCLTCHGKTPAPAVAKALAAKYPKDEAVGYAEGDFRGVFWAEVAP